MRTLLLGGQVLVGNSFAPADVALSDEGGGGCIKSVSLVSNGSGCSGSIHGAPDAEALFNASGLLILPGIVDIHGDAFERQIEPRPGVMFDAEMALLETDRQLMANGITTAYHGVTWSWEPGLRGADMARAILHAIERLKWRLAADTRFHLRHETFNLDAEAEISEWLDDRRVGCLAFNDHMSGTIKDRHRPEKMRRMVERSGLSNLDFMDLVERTWARRAAVPASIERLATKANQAGTPTLSHDDASPVQRMWFRALGARISEFPTTVAAAEAAAAAGEATVFGAPNVVRGGSHTGCPSASDMVAQGLCTILASDYYYPALLAAPFKLAADGASSLEAAWALVSSNPAKALGLTDRGTIAEGMRADLVALDVASTGTPTVVATIARGRIRYLTDGARLSGTEAKRASARQRRVVVESPEGVSPPALPEPCMTLSSHTAPDAQPLP